MSRLQGNSQRICRVAKDYQTEFVDPIAVEAGEAFTVSQQTSAWERNPAWIWVWCTDQRGKSGWVPKTSIQMGTDGQTGTAHAAYNARELTVTVGQELIIKQQESGWFWCCDEQGECGWVPLSHVVVEP